MTSEYSVEVCKELKGRFGTALLHRPMRIERFDPGTELIYNATGVAPANKGRVHLTVEKFVGGGFAGQVYKVKIIDIETPDGSIGGLEVDSIYAMKILIPPSRFSEMFRNLVYGIGFQGGFQLQSNPAAVRTGAIWQKFIRRAARIRFNNERTVNDIHATFIDDKLGSCGELSDWVEGRTWRLEVDDHLDALKLWRRGKNINPDLLGSAEYRAKFQFMHEFVKLLHDIGAYEFARQYEWSTCKSQPNCLKRQGTDDDPKEGLVAVDFRAGLALLPFLPMSPADLKLIVSGISRGSLVQFDRGDIHKLEGFVEEHSDQFADIAGLLDELKASEKIYRDSVPDITHNHIHLLYDRKLWSRIFDSAVTGWRICNLLDERAEQTLRKCRTSTIVFYLLGMIPFLGKLLRKIWGHKGWRDHYFDMMMNWGYLIRSIKARAAEKVITWHRAGRVDEENAMKVAGSVQLFLCHLPLSILPVGLHKFITDSQFRKEKFVYIFVRPVRLYFNADLREQWLREMVTQGQKKHLLTDEDADVILSQINEPFIQKYLKSLAVHVCTLPVTQIVSFAIAGVYWFLHREDPNAWKIGLGIIALFQVVPISPGSLVRGFYVLYLVVKERDFKNYNIAVFLGFFKYVGYLAFPIQMANHYPALARFMAAHWATEAVHIVPVFGERGALLEHWVFCLFYNWPLTLRRRILKRMKMRQDLAPRYWHAGLCAVIGAGIFGMIDLIYFQKVGYLPASGGLWWLSFLLPLTLGAVVTLGCGGAGFFRRIAAAACCGAATGLIYTVVTAVEGFGAGIRAGELVTAFLWRVFVFLIFSTIGAMITELRLPDPELR